jgi:redox-sensing transcriptional repressor
MQTDIQKKNIKKISVPTLSRLPIYYYFLKSVKASSRDYISCSNIAQNLDMTPIQVRKDLESIGASGRPKIGYEVKVLVKLIAETLGYNNVNEAFLVGAGNLGKALLGYTIFEDYGLKIVAAFDNNPEMIGQKVAGKPVFHIDKLNNLVARMKVKIGIITVSADKTQEVADLLVKAGIEAIWNFAPIHINVPEGIIVQNVNMASSLAVLSNRLREKE